ncbi:MAG: hypothetical protein H6527_00950 [Actinobacteria bacterium]|nr:hypothetical protein [Actinomycetota bacterium]
MHVALDDGFVNTARVHLGDHLSTAAARSSVPQFIDRATGQSSPRISRRRTAAIYGEAPGGPTHAEFDRRLRLRSTMRICARFFDGFPRDARDAGALQRRGALSTFYQDDLDPFDGIKSNLDLPAVGEGADDTLPTPTAVLGHAALSGQLLNLVEGASCA